MLCLTSTRRHPSKNAERANKSAGTGIHFKNIQPGHNIQQWRKLLGSSPTRQVSSNFLVEEWKKPQHREKLEGKELYVTCEQLCFKITKEQWEEAPELKSKSRRSRHTPPSPRTHAAESGYKSVIITAEDTDVMVLCLGMCTRSIPPVPEVRDEEPGKIPGYHHTEPYTGRQRV
ncbi:hypothetical protein GWK47_038207 [Chionoecetes opilio]|uniref:Uncharacterized protein n=1 Tax=Chionoecetes opilio TaxID=41210 RepID=A0A8J5D1Y4_CHIOP|nr:hypothetical protein GWK47_038207 [Chionoecetes opilio]